MGELYLKSEPIEPMRKYWVLTAIILLGLFLRFYQLGKNPPALDWDEASLGYNAYSILKTGADEFGRKFPVSIRSFEDYKPAVYVYLAIPGIFLFGLNEFTTRLPSAVAGTLSLILTYLVVSELFTFIKFDQFNRPKKTQLALLTTLLLAISPWHLQFSRVAFEANTGLFFVLAGILFFLKGLYNSRWFVLSGVLFAFSFYSYHSPRLVVPLLLFGWTVMFFKTIWRQKWWVIASLILAAVILIPFVKEAVSEGRARFTSVTVLNPEERLKDSITRIIYDKEAGICCAKLIHNRRIVYFKEILNGYLDHFNLDFLFLTGDAPLRHHAVDMGLLYIWEAPFILLGILQLLKYQNSRILFWWFLAAPAASALTTGTPHAVRALTYLPTYQIFTAVGLFHFYRNLLPKLRFRYILSIGLSVLVVLNVFYYLNSYYIHTPVEASADWQYGYKQAVVEIKNWESQVDKVIMTYAYDQPHVFILFYDRIDPLWYQKQWTGGEVMRFKRKFGKYEFRPIDWARDKDLKNTLIIGTPSEIPATENVVKEIKFLNGQIAFRVVKL